MKHYLIMSLVGTALLGLSACDNNNNSTPPLTGAFRVVNGVSDSSGISASASSGFVSTGNANFDTAGSTVNPPDGGYNVQLFNNNSSNAFTTVDNVSIQHNNLTTLFTYGSITGGTAKGFTAEENLSAPAVSTDFTLQFVNDTSQTLTATLNLYLVTVGTSITGIKPVATATAANSSADVSVPAGSYEVIVTNTAGTTIYDSGNAAAGILLPTVDTNVIQIGALDATTTQADPVSTGTGSYGSPITLLVMDNNGGETLHFNGKN
jgi:hypothetical protein